MAVQILRLKDGSDVICNTQFKDELVQLELPMMFSMVNQNLVLQHWLPLAVMKGTSVTIRLNEVVCFMEPNDNFQEYYMTAVDQVTTAQEAGADEEMDQVLEALDELENSKGLILH